MMGTLLISGSAAIKFKKVTIASFESNMPSSMLISIICAPLSTCCRATSKAVSRSSSLINRAKRAEPVTLVLSPTLTYRLSAVILNGSKPLKRQ